MRANALVSAGQFQSVIDLLVAEPSTRKTPALGLLLGQANLQAQHLPAAAAAFQNVYYNFPLSAQAKAAGDALSTLRRQLGIAYPEVTPELKTARAEALVKASRYQDALDDYKDLLKTWPSSPLSVRWQLGHARCLVRLHRTTDALQSLLARFAAPDDDAQRLALLVHRTLGCRGASRFANITSVTPIQTQDDHARVRRVSCNLPSRQLVFVASGKAEKLVEQQEELEWTEDGYREDHKFQRLAQLGLGFDTLLILALVGLVLRRWLHWW